MGQAAALRWLSGFGPQPLRLAAGAMGTSGEVKVVCNDKNSLEMKLGVHFMINRCVVHAGHEQAQTPGHHWGAAGCVARQRMLKSSGRGLGFDTHYSESSWGQRRRDSATFISECDSCSVCDGILSNRQGEPVSQSSNGQEQHLKSKRQNSVPLRPVQCGHKAARSRIRVAGASNGQWGRGHLLGFWASLSPPVQDKR